MEETVPHIAILGQASTELRQSSSLRQLLLVLVNIGNYLNGSSIHGNAAGFKLSSLWKMIDLKATKGGSSLLHLLAKMDSQLLPGLQKELSLTQRASEISIEEIKTNLRVLGDQCNKLDNQLSTKRETNFADMKTYLSDHCRVELSETNSSLQEVIRMQNELAIYFCENENSFKLEECFKIFSNFIARLRQAVQENIERDERAARKLKSDIPDTVTTSVIDMEDSENKQREEKLFTTMKMDGEVRQREEKLFATLERGNKHFLRRRSSVRPVEISRERENVVETRVRRLRDERDKEREAEIKEISDDEIKKESSPRITRRRSIAPTNSAPLITMPISIPPSNLSSMEEEAISLRIPNELEGCGSTAGSSPKSVSDEGFESEKDKDNGESISDDCRSSLRKQTASHLSQVTVQYRESIPLSLPKRIGDSESSRVKTVEKSSQSKPLLKPPISSLNKGSLRSSRLPTIRNSLQTSQNSTPQRLQNTTTTILKAPPQRNFHIKVASNNKPERHSHQNLQDIAMQRSTASSGASSPKSVLKSSTSQCLPILSKISTLQKPSPRRLSTPHSVSRPVQLPQLRKSSQPTPRRQISTSDRKEVSMKPAVSTSSRPSLIKTGSMTQRSSLPKMEALEKPKPLKRTDSWVEPKTVKPKWV
uniref:FH2 domain-containing protein n=1 Tax=Heterorhabditis bacteriophora TaxID=37862 RepID=A0A1I7XJR8_HETBA